MKKKIQFMPAIMKAQRVIDSCETVEQLRVARKYKFLLSNWMNREIDKHGGFLTNPNEFGYKLDLTDRLHNKAEELDVLI
jgi:hypothetical protein